MAEKILETGSKGIAENLAGLLRESTGVEILIEKADKSHCWLQDPYGLKMQQPKRSSDIACNGFRFHPGEAFIVVGKQKNDSDTFIILVEPNWVPVIKKKVFFNRITTWQPIWDEIRACRETVVMANKDKRIMTVIAYPSNDDS